MKNRNERCITNEHTQKPFEKRCTYTQTLIYKRVLRFFLLLLLLVLFLHHSVEAFDAEVDVNDLLTFSFIVFKVNACAYG